ncbi:DNA/RNA polymerase, partial [Fomitiporia mediterranea MF3/22]
DYLDRFDKDKADRLLKHSKWDMDIKLKEGVELPKMCPVYPLTPIEQEVVEEFIQENLKKGYIRESHSKIVSLVFFVGKKDLGARMVIDYRKLNQIVEPDPFPIPIMYTLPDYLKEAKWFTTLDLKSGYNNIRIKQGQEYLQAFRTHKGLYEPLVM